MNSAMKLARPVIYKAGQAEPARPYHMPSHVVSLVVLC